LGSADRSLSEMSREEKVVIHYLEAYIAEWRRMRDGVVIYPKGASFYAVQFDRLNAMHLMLNRRRCAVGE